MLRAVDAVVQQLEGLYFSGFEMESLREVIGYVDPTEDDYERVKKQVERFRSVHPRLRNVIEVLRAMSVLEEGDESLEALQEETVRTVDETVGRWQKWKQVADEGQEWLEKERPKYEKVVRRRSWPEIY